MTSRRGGLGRGLGSLIPTGPANPGSATGSATNSTAGARFQTVPSHAIAANPRQPRRHFDEQALAELAASIREVGLLQPVVVREAAPGRYELVMGERRWRACQQAGLDPIPVIVRETDDDAMLRDALLENLHREQLNPLDEAAAYQQLLEDFGSTHEELAGRLGRSRSQVSNTLRLLNLPPAVQRRVAAGVLSAGHARALLALPDAGEQDRLASRIVAEGLSVRNVEEFVTLGVTSSAQGSRRSTPERPQRPELAELENTLSERLETSVRVTLGQRKGKVVVEFATVADLQRIVATIAGSAP